MSHILWNQQFGPVTAQDEDDQLDDDYGFFIEVEETAPCRDVDLKIISGGDFLQFSDRHDSHKSLASDGLTSCESSTKTHSCCSHSVTSEYSLTLSESTTTLAIEDPPTIVCQVDDEQAPITCRTFRDGSAVAVAIVGFRLVQDAAGEAAEFRISLTFDGKHRFCWRRFHDFSELARTYFVYADHLNTLPEYAANPLLMTNSLRVWKKVCSLNPQWGAPHTASNMVSLTSHLKIFLKHLLYEIPAVTELIRFCSNE